VDVGVSAAQYNAALLVGGGLLPQSPQDSTISDASVRMFVSAAVCTTIGALRLKKLVRTSRFIAPILGLQVSPRHLISGTVFAGYLIQNFAHSGLGSTSAPDYGGRLVWNVTPRTTLTFSGLRTFYTGTPSSGTVAVLGSAGNGYLASTVVANADYEFLRNVLINLNASYENDNFQGISRTDNVFAAGAGVRYFVNRNSFLAGSFTYYQRSSTLARASYTQNVVMFRVGTQF
jgi:hypothetical protein